MRQFSLQRCANYWNPPKNIVIALFFMYNFEFRTLSTQKHYFPLIFGRILTICTPFQQEMSQNSDFVFKIKNLTTAAGLASFSKYKTKIGSCLANFYRISKIRSSFWRELSHKSEPVFIFSSRREHQHEVRQTGISSSWPGLTPCPRYCMRKQLSKL